MAFPIQLSHYKASFQAFVQIIAFERTKKNRFLRKQSRIVLNNLLMNYQIVKVSTSELVDSQYWSGLLYVINNAYDTFFGIEYHLTRLLREADTIYLALVEKTVVGFTYVKSNNRRGTTAIFPIEYRNKGLAEALIKSTIPDFPNQYALIELKASNLFRLLQSCDFEISNSLEELKSFLADELSLLTNFRIKNDILCFDRFSGKRSQMKYEIALLKLK